MSVGYFLLAWFWIEKGIRPTVFFGAAWVFMGLMTLSGAVFLEIHRIASSRAVVELREVLRPVLTVERPSVSANYNHTAPARTKVHI